MTNLNITQSVDKSSLIYSTEILDCLAGRESRVYRYAGWTFTKHWAAMGLPRTVKTHPYPQEYRQDALEIISGLPPIDYHPLYFMVGNGYALFNNEYRESKPYHTITIELHYLQLISLERDTVFLTKHRGVSFLGIYRVISRTDKLDTQEQDITTQNYKMRAIISPRRSLRV